ncbi:MAG: class I SAM-dependent methyltransferase [Candidatus Latescibacteria bacterium]|nr:class I SAM-dependent methyltransferase [Candidatus Latescibacterota bacterium]
MLKKAASKPEARQIRFVISDVKALPFIDDTFDLITISFATRNLNISRDILTETFHEFYRVLKPGGRFVNLETSRPPSAIIRKLYNTYIGITVKPVGYFLSGSSAGYAYLSHTIPRFYGAVELKDIILEAGFGTVDYTGLMFGAAAIHVAKK